MVGFLIGLVLGFVVFKFNLDMLVWNKVKEYLKW